MLLTRWKLFANSFRTRCLKTEDVWKRLEAGLLWCLIGTAAAWIFMHYMLN